MGEAVVASARPSIRLGLKENWRQFSLLVLINAFVGGMVGIERTVVPLIGAKEFHIESTTLITSFIISFGVIKALANLVSGQLADTWGRKRVLVVGWLLALPVPFMIIGAPHWEWVIAANVLLGASQSFAWSMTVIMKVDLIGPKGRGLAVGLNEFAGYFAVGLTAFLTGYLASRYGLRPIPIYLGIFYVAAGLILSILVVRARGLKLGDYLFPSRLHASPHLSTRQYARIVHRWVASIGLDDSAYGTHSIRCTKAALIYRRTKNLRAVQLLLGHTKLESTVRYLGIEVDDALEMAEQTEV